jgi:TIR domain
VEGDRVAGHAFISYVREDSRKVNRLQRLLEAAGVPVWRDTANLWPGEDWRARIRIAITSDALAFIACFSSKSLARGVSYQNEEFLLAIDQLRIRRPDASWLIPVRFDDCSIPDWPIGGERTLSSIQRVDLFGRNYEAGATRLTQAVMRILNQDSTAPAGIHPAGKRPAQASPGTTPTKGPRKSSESARRARQIERVDLPDGPAGELRDLIYDLYLEADSPALDEITALISASDDLPEAPGRDVIRSIISGRRLPASWHDAVTVGVALVRKVAPDTNFDTDVERSICELWVSAKKSLSRESAPAAHAASPGTRPPGWIRVRDASGRALGVHASISVDGARGELPLYVSRDVDKELGETLDAGTEGGCFILLMGGSSVGKTRALFEAMRRVVPDWRMVSPADSDQLRELVQAAAGPIVVWLDDMHNFLDSPAGLLSAVHRFLEGGAIVLATVWRDDYVTWVAPTEDPPDPYTEHRRIIDLAHVIAVAEDLSGAERDRAEALAEEDPRLSLALSSEDQGVFQVIAAGPDLVRCWEEAPDPYGKAVITAAVDVRRLGAHTPPSRELLEALALAYLKPTELALAPPDWSERALRYATTLVRRAAAALTPVGERIGQISGYVVADYLYQHASRVRRSQGLPDAAWQAIAGHHDARDAHRLADAAKRRMRHEDCEAIYKRAAEHGDVKAARELIDMLTTESRIDEALGVMRHYDATCSGMSAVRIADYLIANDRVDEAIAHLHAHVESCGSYVLHHLITALRERDRVDEALDVLRSSAGVYVEPTFADIVERYGDPAKRPSTLAEVIDSMPDYSPLLLADLLAEQGRFDELFQREKAGDQAATDRLDRLLADEGRFDELYARLDGRGHYTAVVLAEALISQGRPDEALCLLRERTDGGDPFARQRLAQLLRQLDHIEELRQRAEHGDDFAASELADVTAAQGDLDELQARARAGDRTAFAHVLNHFLEHPSEEGLGIVRQIAGADGSTSIELVMMLAKMNRVDDLEAMAKSGDVFVAARLADTYARLGMIEPLRARADAGDMYAATVLLDVLEDRGGVEELVTEVNAGTKGAAERIIRLFHERSGTDS